MANRQDIDALIVGAVYGELDASEQAQLDAHLTSHPEDRAALEALERTRAQVRRGLEGMTPAEPPPSISALLLQEAARRGPHPSAAAATEPAGAGWWSRFVDKLRAVGMNPAFAGAAALVLVGGTAAALYLRNPATSEPTIHEPRASAQGERAEQAPGATPPADPAPALTAAAEPEGETEGYRADLADEAVAAVPPADREADGKADKNAPAPRTRTSAPARDYVEVEKKKEAVAIKDAPQKKPQAFALEESADGAGDDRAATRAPAKSAARGAGGEAVAADLDVAGTAPPPPPPSAGATEPSSEPKAVDPKLEQWAKTEHARLAKLVAAGKCPEAGRIGAELKHRAPEYYAQHVANDRAIRSCKSYIEDQARKKAAKDYKSRSQTNSVESADDVKPTQSQ